MTEEKRGTSGTAPSVSVSLGNNTLRSVSFPKAKKIDYLKLFDAFKADLAKRELKVASFSKFVQHLISSYEIEDREGVPTLIVPLQ